MSFRMPAGDRLLPGASITSRNQRFKLHHGKDGNITLSHKEKLLWASKTVGKPTTHLTLQPDGDLVLCHNAEVVWRAGSRSQVPNDTPYMILQNDGNFVVHSADGKKLWATSTTTKFVEEPLIATMIDQAALRLPAYASYIHQAKPVVLMGASLAEALWPILVRLFEIAQVIWKRMQPYDPQQFGPLVFGLILCFFGGSYVTLIAAYEAVRLTVWDRLSKAIIVLYDNYVRARDVSAKDDAVDEDGNGIPDVQEISKKDLLQRKVYLIMKTVDPDRASEALALLWGAILSVIATLRVQFAQAVTLGCSIGLILHKHLGEKLEPAITQALPPDLQRWGPTATRYIFKTMAVMLAWMLQRIISGFHSAIRGGQMFIVNAVRLAKKHGRIDASFDENDPKVSVLGWVIAFLGFYWQFSNGFALPFPLNLLMLPVTILEWLLEVTVGV